MNLPRISVASLSGRRGWRRLAGEAIAPLADRLLGIHAIDALYRSGEFFGLAPFDFVARALGVLDVTGSDETGELARSLPRSGPVLIVSNHPYGAIEALVIADAVGRVRQDLRFLANEVLKVFPELAPLIIGTDPLAVTPRNLRSIRECDAHLAAGGVLAVFPSGRVSYPRPDGRGLADGPWNRVVGRLALRNEATLVPVHFEGGNSRLFHRVGELFGVARMALLPRELLRLRGQRVRYASGRPLRPAAWRQLDAERLTACARLATYLQASPARGQPVAADAPETPLAPAVDPELIVREIDSLGPAHRLLDFRHYSVFQARAREVPAVMLQIARERERVFRALAEGSGAGRDGDHFDETYVQLFVWDRRDRAIVGAYRMGRADELRRERGAAGNYLSQMFEFRDDFYLRADGGFWCIWGQTARSTASCHARDLTREPDPTSV